MPTGTLWEVRDGTAGFQALATIISERYGIDPPLDRRRIRDWWNRGTVNAAGVVFPDPVSATVKSAGSKRRYMWFDIEEVATWVRGGIPGYCGSGWKYPTGENSAKL